MTRAVVVWLLCVCPALSVAQQPPRHDGDLIRRLDTFVEHEVAASRIPGVAFAIVRDGQRVHGRGVGTDGLGHAVTADTPFPIGSLTKSFTALLTRQLIEEGRIEVDAPVQRYLPWFRVADSAASTRITVRHLLNQTSGLSRADGMTPLLQRSQVGVEELARAMRSLALNRPVGTRYEYCNLNFVLLGAVLQQVTAQSWEALVHARVLEPLGTEHSHANLEDARRDGLTGVHRFLFGVPVAHALPVFSGLAPTGGLMMSANDMARYLAMLLRGGTAAHGPVLSPAGVAQLLAPASPPASSRLQSADFRFRYGEGWFVGPFGAASDARWHLGDLSSFAAWMILLPDTDEAVVVLINANAVLPFDGISATSSRIPLGVVNILRRQPPPAGPNIPDAYRRFNAVSMLLIFALALLSWWASRPARAAVVPVAMLTMALLLAAGTLVFSRVISTLWLFAPEPLLLGAMAIILLLAPAATRRIRSTGG
jgi:CubicO group peptidase (beta-lactamase class C family)